MLCLTFSDSFAKNTFIFLDVLGKQIRKVYLACDLNDIWAEKFYQYIQNILRRKFRGVSIEFYASACIIIPFNGSTAMNPFTIVSTTLRRMWHDKDLYFTKNVFRMINAAFYLQITIFNIGQDKIIH